MLELVVLFLVFYGPLAFGCVEPWSLAILQVLLFSLPLLARMNSGRPAGMAPWPLLFGLCGLFIIGAAQALHPVSTWGPWPLLPFTVSPGLTQKALLLWAAYVALLWAAPVSFADARAARRFAWAVLLIGFTVAAIGLIQAAHGNRLILGFREVGYGRSPFGPYYNNSHAASLLAVAALMGFGLLASELVRAFGESRRGARADDVAIQALISFFLGIILWGLFATHNRGSILALAAASLIVGFMACGLLKTRAGRWRGRAVLLGVFLGAAVSGSRLGFMRRGAQSSVPIRLSMYRSGLTLLADSPLWGTGLGTVIAVFEPYKDTQVIGVVDHVHNDWLELLLQAGIAGAALVFAALVAFSRRVYAGWLQIASMERRCLIGGGIAAGLCFALHALVEFAWQIPSNAVIFLLILCWLWSQTAEKSHGGGIPVKRRVSS